MWDVKESLKYKINHIKSIIHFLHSFSIKEKRTCGIYEVYLSPFRILWTHMLNNYVFSTTKNLFSLMVSLSQNLEQMLSHHHHRLFLLSKESLSLRESLVAKIYPIWSIRFQFLLSTPARSKINTLYIYIGVEARKSSAKPAGSSRYSTLRNPFLSLGCSPAHHHPTTNCFFRRAHGRTTRSRGMIYSGVNLV